MSQALNLKIKGLYTHPNDLSEIPQGALAVADNIVINRESTAEPRRGFDRLAHALTDVNSRVDKLFTYQGKILAHYDTTKLALYDTSSGWLDYSGSFAHPDVNLGKMRSAEANSNIYLTTATGIQVLDAYNGTAGSAGMPQGLDALASLTGSSGFLSDNTQVAYRILWGIKDANSNLVLGTPSQRSIIANAVGGGATRDTSLAITIPAGITVNHFFQVYRSAMSASSTTEPTDELGLVYEGNPSAGEIIAKTLTITDSTPEDLRGATLYTSASQEGIAQGNDEPPLAQDVASFKNCLWFANTKSKHRLTFTILAAGGTTGIHSADTMVIAGTTYTAGAAENVGTRTYKLTTSGTPAQNIADTSLSLVRVINQNATNTTVYAFYESGYGDLPGQILIEERSIGGNSYAITVSGHSAAFNPQLPTSGTTVSSSNDTFLNGLYNSKDQRPEAVPIANVRRIGSAAKRILRIIPLRDALFVLKEDGIWRVTGEYPTFNVDELDITAKLLAPESAVALNNQIFALTDQGVVSISDTGIQVKSRPIENQIIELFGDTLTNVKNLSFGIGYETERKYILFMPSSAAETFATQAYVYNTFTNTWTRWPLSKTCGILNTTDDKLYLGDALGNYVNQERKSFTFTDYVDEATDGTVVSASGFDVVLSSVIDVEIGDLVFQSISVYSQVLSINPASNTVTLNDVRTWTPGACTLYKGIASVLEWVPQSGGNPGLLKQFQEASLIFRNNYFPVASVGFYSELSGSVEDTDLTGTYGGLWGLFLWGNGYWGGIQRPRILRTYVPLEKAWCALLSVRFTHKMGYSQFQLEGVSIPFEEISQVVTK